MGTFEMKGIRRMRWGSIWSTL